MTYWLHRMRLNLLMLRISWNEARRDEHRQGVRDANMRIDRLSARHMELHRNVYGVMR